MELTKLRYFAEVCRYGNMTKAARSLFVSQQNVSKAIVSLEQELQTQLFIRSGTNLVITPDGEYLLQKANWILAEVNVVQSHFERKSRLGHTIPIAVTQGLLARCGKEAQNLIFGKNERFNISFIQQSPKKTEDDVRSGAVRFGLVLYYPQMSLDFDVIFLSELTPLFVVSKKHPLAHHDTVSVYQMTQYPMVAPGPGLTGNEQMEYFFQKKGLKPYVVFSSNTASEIMELVRNNESLIGGITAQDYGQVSHAGLVKLVPSVPMEPMRIALISRRNEPVLRHEKAFRDALIQGMTREPSPCHNG